MVGWSDGRMVGGQGQAVAGPVDVLAGFHGAPTGDLLCGSVTAISGHGLGTFAISSAVSPTEFANGTIANAGVFGTAATGSMKIDFADDSLGDGKMDDVTISNFVSTGIGDYAPPVAMTIHSFGEIGIGTTSRIG